MKEIPESDIIFGPYDEKELFHIEKSEIYESLGAGIKTVEFILKASVTESRVIFVEAKKNAPNPENRDTSEKKDENLMRSIQKYQTNL